VTAQLPDACDGYAEPLALPADITAVIRSQDDVDCYAVELSTGGVIEVSATAITMGVDVDVEVTDEQGNTVVQQASDGDEHFGGAVDPGQYVIVVRGYGPVTGDYALVLDGETDVPGTIDEAVAIGAGEQLGGIQYEGDVDTYRLAVPQNHVLELTLTSSTGQDLDLYLIDEDDNVLHAANSQAVVEEIVTVVGAARDLFVEVRGYNAVDNYTLTVVLYED